MSDSKGDAVWKVKMNMSKVKTVKKELTHFSLNERVHSAEFCRSLLAQIIYQFLGISQEQNEAKRKILNSCNN